MEPEGDPYLAAPREVDLRFRDHSDIAAFLCEQCGTSFDSEHSFAGHRHDGRPRKSCHLCPKVFASPYKLRVHLRCHSGTRPFACKRCVKAFTERCALNVHTRTHTGERPFVCTVCGRGFRQRQHLLVHSRGHPADPEAGAAS
jgi:KRAB domain-containing zinc finger protein